MSNIQPRQLWRNYRVGRDFITDADVPTSKGLVTLHELDGSAVCLVKAEDFTDPVWAPLAVVREDESPSDVALGFPMSAPEQRLATLRCLLRARPEESAENAATRVMDLLRGIAAAAGVGAWSDVELPPREGGTRPRRREMRTDPNDRLLPRVRDLVQTIAVLSAEVDAKGRALGEHIPVETPASEK